MKRLPSFAMILLYIPRHLVSPPQKKSTFWERTRPLKWLKNLTRGPKTSSIPISSLYCPLKNAIISLRMSLFVYLKSFDHIDIKCKACIFTAKLHSIDIPSTVRYSAKALWVLAFVRMPCHTLISPDSCTHYMVQVAQFSLFHIIS